MQLLVAVLFTEADKGHDRHYDLCEGSISSGQPQLK